MKWFTLALLTLAVGCNKSDVEHLTAIGRKVGERVDAMTPSDPALLQTWDTLSGRGTPAGRVRQRLQSDQVLTGCTINVETLSPGQVKLSGSVKEARQKLRAVELAKETIGVEEVVDELQIQ